MKGYDQMQIKSIIRQHWNNRAKIFDLKPEHLIANGEEKTAWQNIFCSRIGKGCKNVLDIGTGTGIIAMLLAEMGHKVTAVDFSAEMLKIAKEKAAKRHLSINFLEGDAELLPFGDKTFDAVVNRHLLWTLPHPQKALSEWMRVLMPHGVLIIIDGNWGDKKFMENCPHINKDEESLEVYQQLHISDKLPMQQTKRPDADLKMLKNLGVAAQADSLNIPSHNDINTKYFVVAAIK